MPGADFILLLQKNINYRDNHDCWIVSQYKCHTSQLTTVLSDLNDCWRINSQAKNDTYLGFS